MPSPRLPSRWGRWRRTAARLALAAAAATGLSGAVSAASLRVSVDGVLPGGGPVLVSLCAGGLEPMNCLNGTSQPATAPRLVVAFANVAPGTYAVAAFQDLNGDGTLDRSRNGLPLEPYAFSNGAGRTGAPRFERAAVRIEGDTALDLHLTALAGRRAEPR